MDFITDLPQTKRKVNSIWVVVNRLTKRCHFVPTTKTVTAEGVAQLFADHIWKLHGMPTSIEICFRFWQHIFKPVGTRLSITVAHRAQGGGQTERMNRTLEEYLRCYMGPLQDDWDLHLANAEFAVNSTVNSRAKLGPFEADLGGTVPERAKGRRGAEFQERQNAILFQCREALGRAQEWMRDYDQNRDEQVFKVGDQVYLSTRNRDPKHTGLPNSSKFDPKWIGPYTVVQKVHNYAYELNIQAGNKLHPAFNTGSLKPYKESTRLSKTSEVILADGSVGHVIKSIKGKRRRKRHWLPKSSVAPTR
ncbi:Transposon Ty3-G Gag-pol Polyprotein [Phytophthora palmivora]|uniref:Transposon Ty3-G Gag-pol Polyprotein n=1 Tax=Phytophthora palmivora TaxID=4796 RepID=A0A2P4XVI6_9STRA|nr:Transposon Ty3-G Gag-pol Polyprotein [Phytophthora palmivora]